VAFFHVLLFPTAGVDAVADAAADAAAGGVAVANAEDAFQEVDDDP